MRRCSRFPIWPCSVRGFACHLPYSKRGALLPHLFTLTFRLASPRLAQGRPRRLWLHRSHGLALREPRRGESKGGIFSVPLVLRVAPTGNYPAHCPAEFGLSSFRLGLSTRSRLCRRPRSRRSSSPPRRNLQRTLSVGFLRNPVLLELLVEVAAGRIDDLRGLRNIPGLFAEFRHQPRPLGGFFEFP